MYIGVLMFISGLAVVSGSRLLIGYLIFIAAAFHGNLVLVEEPMLARRFGDKWLQYSREVHR